MHARNRNTGAAIVGTLELIQGRADIIADSFKFDDKGKLLDPTGYGGFEHSGHTEIFWDEQKTLTGRRGYVIFVDENGDECTARDVESYDAEAEERAAADPVAELQGQAPNAAERKTERRTP